MRDSSFAPRSSLGRLLAPQSPFFASALFASSAAAQPPANDECAGAIPVFAGDNPVASTLASTTSAPPWTCGFAAGSDVWFSFLSTCGSTTRFATCAPGGASFDTTIAVYGGTCGALVPLGCNDDGCVAAASDLSVATSAGSTYWIRVGGYAGAAGDLHLYVDPTAGSSGSFASLPTGCAGLSLAAGGEPTPGAPVTLTLSGVAGGFPLIWFGDPLLLPLCGAGCIQGAHAQLIFFAASLGLTVPCDPALLGATIRTQGASLFAAGGCDASLFGFPFLLSNTIVATIG